MIWFAKRQRDDDAFAEAIEPELRALRTPPATPELRDRILADRRGGTRVILPVGRVTRRSTSRYVIAAVLVVAAVLTLPIFRGRLGDTADLQPESQFFYFDGVARAAESPAQVQLPPAIPSHPERVHPSLLEYLRVWQDASGRATTKMSSLLSVRTAGSSWQVVSTRRELTSEPETVTAETLLVARSDLRLVSRAVHVRPYRRWKGINIEQHFFGDSVTGRMTLDGVDGMRPIARRLPATEAPYIADVFAPVFFASAPLDRSWRGRVTVLGWAVVPNDVMHSVSLRVTGEEEVQVPAGRFDCWRLEVAYSGGSFAYWIRKADGIAIRTEERQRDGGRRLVTLEREAAP
jgi:hypothetical protein